jgi:mRNA interferase HicA
MRQLRKFARKTNMAVVVDKSKGKGSHARVKYGGRVTTVPRKIGPALRRAILKQLGIDPHEFDAA